MSVGRPRKDQAETRAAILAACEQVIREGRFPSTRLLAAMTRCGDKTCAAVREELVNEGLIVVGPRRKNQHSCIDDPYTEKPDAPNAAEIQARIAAIGRRRNVHEPWDREDARVVHRCELPVSRPRSRQRVTA